MESNPQLELAYDFLEYTGVNVFLTGKAGTGKTTFLRELKRRSPKRMIVVAPTGVAAINAGGVTIHSFFQLPFGPYVPGSSDTVERGEKLQYTHKFNREKINIIKTIDLLVIDDLGAERTTDFVIEQLVMLLEDRNAHDKAWIISSNLNINEIAAAYNDRTADRILDRAMLFKLNRASSIRQDQAAIRFRQL